MRQIEAKSIEKWDEKIFELFHFFLFLAFDYYGKPMRAFLK